jgi:hypothetical protein
MLLGGFGFSITCSAHAEPGEPATERGMFGALVSRGMPDILVNDLAELKQ